MNVNVWRQKKKTTKKHSKQSNESERGSIKNKI